MSGINQWLLGILGTPTILVLLVVGLSRLRDEFVHQGWVSESSRLTKMTRRAEASRFRALVTALGIDQAEIQEATGRKARNYRRIPQDVQRRADVAFLMRAEHWVRVLEPPFTYHGSAYYLDMMGAIHHRRPSEVSLEQIMHSWIRELQSADKISEFDVLIGIKDGNPLLAEAVARQLNVPLILCKSLDDKATVARPDGRAWHETDFEGLYATNERHGIAGRPLRPVIVDDSCSRGSQILSAAQRFNSWVASQPSPAFSSISTAVVLFRFSRPGSNSDALRGQVNLHSLVSVGEPELKELSEGRLRDILKKDPTCQAFKKDNACASSRDIFRVPGAD